MRFAFWIVLCCLLFALQTGNALAGALQGSVVYDYVDYRAKVKDQPDETASSFTQQYSLLYSGGDYLGGGRVGLYTYAFGAEYAAFNTSVNDSDWSADAFKPLYRGELLVAPGGLPFRLHLFCFDQTPTTFTSQWDFANALLRPAIAGDLYDGTHRTTGGTLLLGIKNGTYLGHYRDVLSKYPRLLVDYRESEVESKSGRDDVHYVNRDLAFVSLNKKDNWFHYRIRQYHDYLAPNGENDRQTRTYILGTIDPTLSRTWINMTNWIKLSTDGSYAETRGGTGAQEENSESYRLNLFANARRRSGAASTYTHLSRTRDDESLTESLTVPFYFHQDVDRTLRYNGRFIYTNRKEIYTTDDPDRERENIYFKLGAETRRTQRYIVAPEIAMEVNDDSERHGEAVEAGVEIYNNSRYKSPTTLRLGYTLRSIQGEYYDQSANYFEQELNGRVTTLSRNFRYGGEGRIILGNGEMPAAVTSRIRAATAQAQMNSASAQSSTSGTAFRSVLSGFVDESTRAYRNGLRLSIDYLKNDTRDSLQTEFDHNFSYAEGRALSYVMENVVMKGDNQTRTQGDISGNRELQSDVGGHSDLLYRHKSELRYVPNRIIDGKLTGKYLAKRGGRDSDHYLAGESLRYHIYTVNGIVRRIADLSEQFEFEEVLLNGQRHQFYGFSLSGQYNPWRSLSFNAYVNYTTRPESGEDTWSGRAGARWVFPKFSVALNYACASRTTDSTIPGLNRKEQLWRATVEKIF